MVPCKYGNTTLAGEEDIVFVASAPVVLYSVVMANDSSSVVSKASLHNGGKTTVVMDFVVPVGDTVVWTGCVALPKGLAAVCESGGVRVTVMYV